MCQQGIVAIIPVRNDYIVVIVRASLDDLARIELQFGKALNSNEVLEMCNDEIFGFPPPSFSLSLSIDPPKCRE